MNVLIIDQDCVGLDFAQRCVTAGHEVRLFQYSKNPTRNGEGFAGVKRIDEWQTSMKWARDGLIMTTVNNRYLKELDAYREHGFKIFGPTQASAALEIDRAKGLEAMQAAGIDVPVFQTFDSLGAAEKFARKADQPYVFKTMGDEEDKSLSYVASDPADLVGWLQRKQAQGYKLKGPCMLQEKIDMMAEVGVSGWFGPEGFLKDKWQICFEHKKLMSGNYGPNCFTPDAEVLTRTGWKFWPDVTMDDEICTLIDGRIDYEKPSQVVVGQFDGDLIGWQSGYVDILVTPGHNMFVQDDHGRQPFYFEPAAVSLDKRRNVMRAGGEWAGEGNWAGAALVGAYIADGHCRDRSVVFGNCPVHKAHEFTKFARQAGYAAEMYGRDLYINSVDLVAKFSPLGDALTKRVPQGVKDADPETIMQFLVGYVAGDGSRRENNLTCTTISKDLAGDLQELCLKVGWAASIRVRDRVGKSHDIAGYECINKHVAYEIGISKEHSKAEISPDIAYLQAYSGKVYCVTVSSHVIFVRRNGKACWIGQTGEQGTVCQYVSNDKMAEEMLRPMEAALLKAGHTGDFAIGCGIDSKGRAWPFEFTARLGWPAFFIQVASHKGDPAQWMRDLIDGKDSLKVSNDVAIGVVMAQPRYPYGDSDPLTVCCNPITGVEDVWDQVHPVDMMIGKGPVMDGGKVVDAPTYQTSGEYVMVVTGLGKTVSKARDEVYGAVKEIKFSNAMVRDDVGESVIETLPKLHAMGYAMDMKP